METLFTLANLSVLPFWALMILAPGWRWTERVVRTPAIALAPALVYAALVVPRLGSIVPAVARPELGSVAALLGSSDGALVAWVHFLAFDLLVGRWVYRDARERGVPAWLTSPVLSAVFLLGPLGFVAHLAARTIAGRRASPRAETP